MGPISSYLFFNRRRVLEIGRKKTQKNQQKKTPKSITDWSHTLGWDIFPHKIFKINYLYKLYGLMTLDTFHKIK